jgi:hypothetical protein
MEVSQLHEPITLPPGNTSIPRNYRIGGWVDAGEGPADSEKRKSHYHFPAIELFLGRPDRSLVTILSYVGSGTYRKRTYNNMNCVG